jgi:hypothetical protein
MSRKHRTARAPICNSQSAEKAADATLSDPTQRADWRELALQSAAAWFDGMPSISPEFAVDVLKVTFFDAPKEYLEAYFGDWRARANYGLKSALNAVGMMQRTWDWAVDVVGDLPDQSDLPEIGCGETDGQETRVLIAGYKAFRLSHFRDAVLLTRLSERIDPARAKATGILGGVPGWDGREWWNAHIATSWSAFSFLDIIGQLSVPVAVEKGWRIWKQLKNGKAPDPWVLPEEDLVALFDTIRPHLGRNLRTRTSALEFFNRLSNEILVEHSLVLATLEANQECSAPPLGPRPTNTSSADAGGWTTADGVSQWAKVFGVSADTMARKLRDGTIRNKKLTSKIYQIGVDDLPAKHRTKFQAVEE